MKPSFYVERAGFLPAIDHERRESDPQCKTWFLPRFEVLDGDHLATAATAKKYAQIEINRRNEIGYKRPSIFAQMDEIGL